MAAQPARLRRAAGFFVIVPDRAGDVGRTWRSIPSVAAGISVNGEPPEAVHQSNACDFSTCNGRGDAVSQKILLNQATIALEISSRHVGHLTHIVVVANLDAGDKVRIRFKLLRLDVSHRSALQLQTKPR